MTGQWKEAEKKEKKRHLNTVEHSIKKFKKKESKKRTFLGKIDSASIEQKKN